MKTVRRWWRFNNLKSKIKKITNNIKTKKILRIEKLPQVKFLENISSKKTLWGSRSSINCYPLICSKSSKFKKSFKLFRINRWVFLNECRKNNIPNLKKYVW